MFNLKKFSKSIAISIVSHGQVNLLNKYLPKILVSKEINELIITHNYKEDKLDFDFPKHIKVRIFTNKNLKGFAENHNTAFKYSNSQFFCVLNPDVWFPKNLFNSMLNAFESNKRFSMLAPLVFDNHNNIQDSFRSFPGLYSIFKRKLLKKKNLILAKSHKDEFLEPEWIAGMFMLFKSNVYKDINGFDSNFFLYCEDIDICLRLKKNNYNFALVLNTSIYHLARRKSRFNLYFFYLHLKSLFYLYFKYPTKLF